MDKLQKVKEALELIREYEFGVNASHEIKAFVYQESDEAINKALAELNEFMEENNES